MVPHSKVPEIVKSADIFVNPTMSDEGMATTNIETMAMGLCVIATDGYGNNEVILDKKTGFLYPARDIQFLSKILESLLNDKKLVLDIGKSASEHIQKHFGIRLITDQYFSLYLQMVDKK